MDVLTHALLGAALSYTLFTKQLGRKALWVGAAAATAPDLDILIFSSQDPTIFMTYHRHFTHALGFIPVGGLLIAGILLLLFKNLRAKWPYVLLAGVVTYATHGLLDACTSYGTLLLWPFSDRRIAWDIISIVDPIFTGILIIGLILAYRRESPKPTLYALIACLLYLGFGFFQHHRALVLQEQLAHERKQTIEKGRVLPQLGNLLGFHSVYISKHRVYLDDIRTPVFEPAHVLESINLPLVTQEDLPPAIKNKPLLLQDFSVFNWFSDGYITVLELNPLILTDLRYVRSIVPLEALWGIEFPQQASRRHVYWINK